MTCSMFAISDFLQCLLQLFEEPHNPSRLWLGRQVSFYILARFLSHYNIYIRRDFMHQEVYIYIRKKFSFFFFYNLFFMNEYWDVCAKGSRYLLLQLYEDCLFQAWPDPQIWYSQRHRPMRRNTFSKGRERLELHQTQISANFITSFKI